MKNRLHQLTLTATIFVNIFKEVDNFIAKKLPADHTTFYQFFFAELEKVSGRDIFLLEGI